MKPEDFETAKIIKEALRNVSVKETQIRGLKKRITDIEYNMLLEMARDGLEYAKIRLQQDFEFI